MTPSRTHQAISADGTRIAGRVDGHGPPLVLVPGGPADGQTGWLSLLPHLTDRFTCFGMNTRGRGLSDDHPDHSRERLVEDVVALVESIGGDVVVFGHSAGGAHALEAAAHTDAVGTLALYEPTLTEFADEQILTRYEAAFARVRQAVAQGRLADGAQIFLEDLAMATDTELAIIAEVDATQEMAPLVQVVVDEEARSGLPQLSDLALLERVTVPVRILYGGATHPFYIGVARQLADRLVDCSTKEIAGLGHLGPEVEPEPVAAELVALVERATLPR